MNNRALTLIGIFLLSLLLGAGFWLWMVVAGDRSPKIKDLVMAPDTFRFAGGDAQVQAVVTDDQGVERVMAVLLSDDLEVLRVDLAEVESTAEAPVYRGEFRVPANIRSDGESTKYTLKLVAVDTAGQDSVKGKDFAVPSPSAPPDPPD